MPDLLDDLAELSRGGYVLIRHGETRGKRQWRVNVRHASAEHTATAAKGDGREGLTEAMDRAAQWLRAARSPR